MRVGAGVVGSGERLAQGDGEGLRVGAGVVGSGERLAQGDGEGLRREGETDVDRERVPVPQALTIERLPLVEGLEVWASIPESACRSSASINSSAGI